MKNLNIPLLLKRKYFWQTLLGIMFLIFVIFFIRNERVELSKIRPIIADAKWYFILAGTIVAFVSLFLQALLYVWSFKSLGKELPLLAAGQLFLKRNVVGILIPGGTFSSLAFFNSELDKFNISKTQQYLGSYIFALASIISIIVIAIPAFIVLALKNQLNGLELAGFALLCLVILMLAWGFYKVAKGEKKGLLYQVILKYKPDWLAALEEISEQHISLKRIIQSCLVSVCIEVLGVAHLYLALLAVNAIPFFAVALTGYVAMIIIMSFSPFMRGLGAVELSLTYLLVQFGYETSLAASITLIFRFFEFWLPLAIGLFVFIIKKESVLLRLIPSLLLLVSGIVNVVSVLTPAIPVRLAFINNRIPEDLVQFSNFGVLIFGIVLIVISGYLFMGSKNAWKTALVLTLFSALGHLTKAVDYEEATVSFVTFLALLYTRKSYFLKHNIPLQIRKLKRTSFFVALFFVYGILGFYLLDKIHFSKDLTLIDSVQMFYQSLLGQQHYIPRTNFAQEFIYSLRFAGAGIVLYVIWLFMAPLKNKKSQINEERQLANELIKKIGNSRLDYFKVYFDKLFYFNPLKTGFLSYKIANNYAVVLENPVCATTQEIIDLIFDFKQHCRINGLGLFFYRIPETYLDIYKSCDFKSILIGQEAIVSLDTFSLVGGERSSLRNVLNSVKKKGLSSKIYEPPLKDGLIQKLENVSDEWLIENKLSEVAFTQGVFNKEELKDSVLITIENNEEEILAFVNLIPDYNKVEGTYDLIRRAEDAPNGVVDFLLIKTFEYFKANGYLSVHLGMSALSGFQKGHSVKERVIYYITEFIKNNSRFKGLHDFKDKFAPLWSNTYLVYDELYDLFRFPAALKKVSKTP